MPESALPSPGRFIQGRAEIFLARANSIVVAVIAIVTVALFHADSARSEEVRRQIAIFGTEDVFRSHDAGLEARAPALRGRGRSAPSAAQSSYTLADAVRDAMWRKRTSERLEKLFQRADASGEF